MNEADWDTDGDGANDGWEALTAGTDPLDADTDKDGLADGAEHAAWTTNGCAWNTDHDSDTLKALRDPDSDNDGLNDRDEVAGAGLVIGTTLIILASRTKHQPPRGR